MDEIDELNSEIPVFKIKNCDTEEECQNEFIKSIVYLTKLQDQSNNIFDSKYTLNALNFLKQIKFRFDKIGKNVQLHFIDIFTRLVEHECLKIMSFESFEMIQTTQLINIRNLIHYLQVLTNTTYNIECFYRSFKEQIECCKYLIIALLNFVLKQANSASIPTELKTLIELILKIIENLTHIFNDYDKEWKYYNLFEIIIKLGSTFRDDKYQTSCIQIITNIYDISKSNDVELDLNDENKPRIHRRMTAINYLMNFKELNKIFSDKLCIKAINWIGCNSSYENQDCNFDSRPFVEFLVKVLNLNYEILEKEIINEDKKDIFENQAKIIKIVTILKFMFVNLISQPINDSIQFCVNFYEQDKSVDLVFRILENKSLHLIVNNYKPGLVDSIYFRLLNQNLKILQELKYYANFFPSIWVKYNCQRVFNLTEMYPAYHDFFNIIPFISPYHDDSDQEQCNLLTDYMNLRNEKETDKIKETREKAFKLLLKFDNFEQIYNSRKALDALTFIESNDNNFESLNPSFMKSYVMLIFEFLKFSSDKLINVLSKFDPYSNSFDSNHQQIINIGYYLKLFLRTLKYLTAKHISICNLFYENDDENILKLFLDFINNDFITSILIKFYRNRVIDFLINGYYKLGLSVIYNVSKIACKFKEQWLDLKAFSVLLSLANKFKKVDTYFQMICFMTISNIASNDDLNNFSSSLSILEIITNEVQLVAEILVKNKNNAIRTKIEIQNDENNSLSKKEIIINNGWYLSELIEALYHFCVNDTVKLLVYENFNLKNYLKDIIYNGNLIEQEYAFKLLNQVCFDNKIANEILNDTKLIDFMNNVMNSKKNIDDRKLVKYVENILWLINKNRKIDDIKNKCEHIMISYNKESRPLCANIKKELESLGHKTWIDFEDISGSTIEAMASAVENASCILLCMTEKYKNSANCRLEAEYVLQLKKPFIPLILQNSYKPDGWLGLMLGAKKYIAFGKHDFKHNISEIHKEIIRIKAAEFLLNNFKISDEDQNVNKTEALISHANNKDPINTSTDSNNVLKWTENDVEKWFKNQRISSLIKKSLTPCNGELLDEIFKMHLAAPEFFFQKLSSESKAKLLEIVFFIRELKTLFSDGLKK